jgi:hypothetical protein
MTAERVEASITYTDKSESDLIERVAALLRLKLIVIC